MRYLNQAILLLAPAHVAQPIAPATFADIMLAPAILPVWDGASLETIYQDAKVNHAFRAWHDSCHIAGNYAFTLEGERATCEHQIAQLLATFPSAPAWAINTIRAEVIGQTEFFSSTGAFPGNQAAFIADYLRDTK